MKITSYFTYKCYANSYLWHHAYVITMIGSVLIRGNNEFYYYNLNLAEGRLNNF